MHLQVLLVTLRGALAAGNIRIFGVRAAIFHLFLIIKMKNMLSQNDAEKYQFVCLLSLVWITVIYYYRAVWKADLKQQPEF